MNKNIILGIISLIIGLFLLEGASRIVEMKDKSMYCEDAKLGWRYKANTILENFPSGERINSEGWRGPSRNYISWNPGLRIITLGDSCTFGVFIPDERNTYPRQLESILKSQYGLQNAEVLNYGVNGYGTFHGSVLAKSYLPSVKPDVAIIYYGWNDRTRIVGWFDHRERVKFINSFWHHFACLRLFYRLTDPCIWNLRSSRKLQSVFGPQWLKRGQTLEQVEENLRSTVALFKRQGIKICLVTTPFGKNDFSGLVKEYEFANKRARLDMVNTIPFCAFAIYEYNQLIKKIAFETKSCLIDLQEEFERYCKNDIEKYFEHNDFVHPNAEGCRLIARWIALALSKDIGEKFYAAQEKSSLQ